MMPVIGNSDRSWLKRFLTNPLSRFRLVANPPPHSHVPAVWYAGMLVEPAEFSQQMASLQLSLQREVTNQPEAAPRTDQDQQAV